MFLFLNIHMVHIYLEHYIFVLKLHVTQSGKKKKKQSIVILYCPSTHCVKNMYTCSSYLLFSFLLSNIQIYSYGSSAVDRGFMPQSGQTKDYKIKCCFSAKPAALRMQSKDLLARNQDNVFEWSDMCIHRLLCQ